jgi:hypothetical protein
MITKSKLVLLGINHISLGPRDLNVKGSAHSQFLESQRLQAGLRVRNLNLPLQLSMLLTVSGTDNLSRRHRIGHDTG